LEPDKDNFVLRIKSGDQAQEVVLTAYDVLALGQASLSFRQNIMTRQRPNTIFVSPADSFAVGWDGLGSAVLIEIRYRPNGNVTFAASPDQVKVLIDALGRLLPQRPATHLTPQ
jgi:hypothetical protein